jgi:hypothetical protein
MSAVSWSVGALALLLMLVETAVGVWLYSYRRRLDDRDWESRNRCTVCLTSGDPSDFLHADSRWCNLHQAQFTHISALEERLRRGGADR